MLKFLMSSTILFSLMMLFSSHPMSMGLILLIQTTLITLLISSISSYSWLSYILFLIMIGGMMVLFIYMTSLASNELFKPMNKFMLLILIPYITMNILMKNEMNLIFNNTKPMLTSSIKYDIMTSMNKIFFIPINLIFISTASYLFLTLIATVKITNIKSGPLRMKN
uniref:NADH-ubiquinone oxidoreductase chain 6 n=1 Tax=Tenomerga trabecula TaxID=2843307 RepID=A0A8F0JXF7_9COLE|nr:NADH dehydrogenase subunit 6 [Tenomerga trabecula]